jgi:hypothetical protein
MKDIILYTLIPRPLSIKTDIVQGMLSIEGNIEHNIIHFRFVFSHKNETSPLCLVINVADSQYTYYCLIRDLDIGTVETPLFHPEFGIGQQFKITAVKPLVDFFPTGTKKTPLIAITIVSPKQGKES